MDGVDKIRAAEANVAQMQDALTALQTGLERAEAVAVAAEEAKQRSEQALRITFGLIGLSVLLIIVSFRRRRT